MKVLVNMKDGRRYKGIKCGNEGSFLYLVNAMSLEKDERGVIEGFLETPVGEEIDGISILLVPIADVETIESSR